MDKKEIVKITGNLPDIVAIAPNAFSRTVPSEFFPNYSIVCFKYRKETDDIAKDMEVFSVEKQNPGIYIEKMNAGEILNLGVVKNFINSKNNPWLLIYKPSTFVETISQKFGWKIIGNNATVKYDIENKLAFRNILDKCGIDKVEGETVPFDLLNEKLYESLNEKYGPKLVFQIAEITSGGGTGTAFINSIDDYRVFMDKFTKKRELISSINNVNVTKFIDGVPTSISACATKYGVITGSIQTQILDIPEVRSLKEGSGLFCGHDLSYGNFDEELNLQAKNLAKEFGDYIYKNLGYKGIFGLDLITNTKEGKVYPIECNPRYTDAFPLISQMHCKEGLIPMDVFHIFEHMNVDYKIVADEVSNSYKILNASQIILETKIDNAAKVTGDIKAGVYKINYSNEGMDISIEYKRTGYRFEDLSDENEFLVTEGVPFKDTIIKAGGRVFRLIFKRSILKYPKDLTHDVRKVIECLYKELDLKLTNPGPSVKDFLGLNVGEIYDICDVENIKNKYMDMINFVGEDAKFGYIRPEKIAWGMWISDDIFTNIRSKKLKKHLRKWLSEMNKYGLSYEIKDKLTDKDFVQWYDKYIKLLSSKEKANIKINHNWLLYKRKMGKNISAVFLYKNNIFIGGNLIVRSDKKFTVVYGIVEKVKVPNWSFGAIVDYLSIDYAKKLRFNRVGFGQDNNLYGHHLSTGLLEYKLNFGLEPSVKNKTQIFSTKIINTKKFKDNIVFLSLKEGKNVFYVLSKKDKSENPLKLNTGLPVIYEKI